MGCDRRCLEKGQEEGDGPQGMNQKRQQWFRRQQSFLLNFELSLS